jgi:hypothetical protein
MMLVDDNGFIPSITGIGFDINVLHKGGTMVEAITYNPTPPPAPNRSGNRWPCDTDCSAYIGNIATPATPGWVNNFHRFDYYIGIADHELGGADPANVNASGNFGFLAVTPAFMY